MATVRIPTPLRKLTQGAEEVSAAGKNIGELIADLEQRFPGIKERICDDKGAVKRFINIFVNEEDIRFQDNLETKLSAGTEVSILPAIAGGNAAREKKAAPGAEFTRRVYLNFNADCVTQPIIYNVVKKFDVVPNIRSASIMEDIGIMSVEFCGPQEQVEKALDWIKKQGVKVDPIEMNVVEP